MPKRAKQRTVSKTTLLYTPAEAISLSGAVAGDVTDGAPAPRRFEMVAYTGAAMRLRGMNAPMVVDLASLRLSTKSRPILRGHDSAQIVGHTTAMHVENNQLIVSCAVSAANDFAREVVESAEAGFPWQVSMGFDPNRIERIPGGKNVQVNGRVFAGPVHVARSANILEVSFVPLGADDNTSARIAAGYTQRKDFAMDHEFETWLNTNGFEDVEALSDAQRATLEDAYQAQNAGHADSDNDSDNDSQDSGNSNDMLAAIRAQHVAETQRVMQIRRINMGRRPDLEAQAIKEGWPADRFELTLLRAERPLAHSVRGGNPVLPDDAREAAICIRAGIGEATLSASYDARTLEAARSREMHRYGMHSLVRDVLRSAGDTTPLHEVGDAEVSRALRSERMMASASGSFSTISLTGILSNVANKAMLEAFQATPSVVSLIARERDVNDFKETTSLRMHTLAPFEEVGPDGELKHAELGEESFKNRLKTYGNMVALTRVMMINDDLGAFLDLPRQIGQRAAAKRERIVFNALLNSGSFFSSGNDNLLTGASTALSVDALTEAEQMFFEATDPTGEPILVTPSILLVAPANATLARRIMSSEFLLGPTSAPTPERNPFAGRFTPVMSPYLSESVGLPNASDLAWYLFASPNTLAALEVIYLRGKRAPTIESSDTVFNTLGVQWRAFFDFGVALHEPRGALKVTGEA